MNGARRFLVVAIVVLGVLAAPALAVAHPLGNFTINTAAGLVVGVDEVLLDHAVDMAEIPTLQELVRLDLDGDGSRSARELTAYRAVACESLSTGLRLQIDGTPTPITLRSSELSLPVGQAGLSTLRLRCVFDAAIDPAPVHDLEFEDRTYPDRLGWREVTAAGDGATIVRSDVPSVSPSDRLRSYPTGGAPSHVLTASLAFRPGGAALVADLGSEPAAPATGGFLAGFTARPGPREVVDRRLSDRGRGHDPAGRRRRRRGLGDAHRVGARTRAPGGLR